jgi:hypothetical protein
MTGGGEVVSSITILRSLLAPIPSLDLQPVRLAGG